jgi:putative ABC transport system substrate-binding protein
MVRGNRRSFLIGAGALVAAPFAAHPQPPGKHARIGFMAIDLAGNPRGTDAFRADLRSFGWVEGRNLTIDLRDAKGHWERLPALAAELVARNVDVIVAPNVLATRAAMQATSAIPIVFAGVTDPVADGLVASLARPSGNVTGLSGLGSELAGKRLELLKEVVPKATRVAILWQSSGSGERVSQGGMLSEAQRVSQALKVSILPIEARDPGEFERAFADMAKARVDALVVIGNPVYFAARSQLTDLAARHRLPAIYGSRQYVDAGGLMAYGPSLADLVRRTATYADKLLRGAKAGELPVEQPTKFELLVNLKPAKALGLKIPQSVLTRADEVIQ